MWIRALLVAAALIACGCAGAGGGPSRADTTTALTLRLPTVPGPTATGTATLPGTVPVQGGYTGREVFCAAPPLTGRVIYDVRGGYASLVTDVHGLPSRTQVIVNWRNSIGPEYPVAIFRSDASGRAIQATLHFYRPGEARGYQLDLTDPPTPGTLGHLEPCG